MAPPVVNSEDPDGTESNREIETEPVPVASETPSLTVQKLHLLHIPQQKLFQAPLKQLYLIWKRKIFLFLKHWQLNQFIHGTDHQQRSLFIHQARSVVCSKNLCSSLFISYSLLTKQIFYSIPHQE